MKARNYLVLAVAAWGMSVPAFGGITYTCDASINATVGGLCNYLNTTIAGEYNSTFSNANASIYIQVMNNGGLGESTTGYLNLVTYGTYQSNLQTESTDAAKLTVPASEPGLYGTGEVELTSALDDAVTGNTGATGVEYNSTSGNAGNGWAGAACSAPGDGAVVVASSTACYNGIITIDTEAELSSLTGQGYCFRGLSGCTVSLDSYDFFSIVEHESDEVLGTSSCIGTSAGPTINEDCGGTSPNFNLAAVDLFRYAGAGTRNFNTNAASPCFSINGGTTCYDGNLYDNTSEVGSDWADFSQGCTFVQDGSGCPNDLTFDILTDGPGSTPGPEVAILNAVGYNLITTSAVPEPGTMALIGLGFAGLVAFRRRRA